MNVFAKRTTRKQSGAALIVFLLVLVTAASFALLKGLNEAATQQYRDAQTAKALAEAKAALIGYAAAANIVPAISCGSNCPRPGDLPCPDKNNDGLEDPPCTNNPTTCPGFTCRLGRLPWKTLGLLDLRDGSGERLWYAVSNNFKSATRTSCGASGAAGCLNSDSRGTITIRRSTNIPPHPYDGSDTNPYVKRGAVLAIISPGPVLRRTEPAGSFYQQVRGCTLGVNCGIDSNGDGDFNDPGDDPEVCTSSPPTDTPKCGPRNFLDRRVGSENNENFVDGSTDGFIQGDIRDAAQNVIVNDKILAISYRDIMPLLERRVAGEVVRCLQEYAAANRGRYPWAAKLDGSAAPNYSDDSNERFGRLPDNTLDATNGDSGGSMSNTWPTGNCHLTSTVSPNTWWLNWKEHVFYAVADAFKPGPISTVPTCGTCLTVNPPSVIPDRQAIVMVAGHRLAASPPDVPLNQIRTSAGAKGDPSNYLEGENVNLDSTYASGAATNMYNDVICVNGICP